MPKRPNQIQFYATDRTKKILEAINSGDKSEFINKAIQKLHERQESGPYYALEQAYEYLKYIPSPEAQAVNRELRNILWKRADAPTSVMCRIFSDDLSTTVEYFTDAEKAMFLAMERPTCLRYQICDLHGKALAHGKRTENGFTFHPLDPSGQ